MITVVVYGQKPERMARLAANVLGRYGAVRLHLNDAILDTADEAPFCCVEAVSSLERLLLPRCVLLFADQSAPRRLEMREDTLVVASSDNRRMSRLLSGRPNSVIICGTGVRDTVTLSSSTGDCAILCAQRRIPTVTGVWVEPFEFAVNTVGCDIRSTLLAAATAAVCGCDMSEVTTIVT